MESVTQGERSGHHVQRDSLDENCASLEQPNLETDHIEIKDLIKTKQWLENQLIELRTELKAAELEETAELQPPEGNDPEMLHVQISQLQNKLETACAVATVRSLMLSRIRDSETLYNNMFTDSDHDDDDDDDDGSDKARSREQHKERKQLLATLCVKQAALTREITNIVQENEEKVSKLNALKSANLDLKQSVQSLMSALVNAKDQYKNVIASTDDEFCRAKESVIHTGQKVEILRHLLQSLIFSSGINWAEDTKLSKLMLDLGRPLEEQIIST